MGDTIRAISEAANNHGMNDTVGIVVLAMFVALMSVHLVMLQKWARSNERLAKASEERIEHVEKRHDAVLVANLSMQKALIEVNASQDRKLDLLVEATKEAAAKVEEQAAHAANQTEILNIMQKGQQLDRELMAKEREALKKIGSDELLKICKHPNNSKPE